MSDLASEAMDLCDAIVSEVQSVLIGHGNRHLAMAHMAARTIENLLDEAKGPQVEPYRPSIGRLLKHVRVGMPIPIDDLSASPDDDDENFEEFLSRIPAGAIERAPEPTKDLPCFLAYGRDKCERVVEVWTRLRPNYDDDGPCVGRVQGHVRVTADGIRQILREHGIPVADPKTRAEIVQARVDAQCPAGETTAEMLVRMWNKHADLKMTYRTSNVADFMNRRRPREDGQRWTNALVREELRSLGVDAPVPHPGRSGRKAEGNRDRQEVSQPVEPTKPKQDPDEEVSTTHAPSVNIQAHEVDKSEPVQDPPPPPAVARVKPWDKPYSVLQALGALRDFMKGKDIGRVVRERGIDYSNALQLKRMGSNMDQHEYRAMEKEWTARENATKEACVGS